MNKCLELLLSISRKHDLTEKSGYWVYHHGNQFLKISSIIPQNENSFIFNGNIKLMMHEISIIGWNELGIKNVPC